MPPATYALYLTVLALGIKFTLGAMQSGTFNAILKKFSLPAIPTAIFPWLGLALGLGAGVVEGLQTGATIAVAIAHALSSALAGGVSAMHLQFVSGRPVVDASHPPIEPGAVAMTPSQVAALLTIPPAELKSVPPPPPPIAAKRRTIGSAVGFAFVALVVGVVLLPRAFFEDATASSDVTAPALEIAAPVAVEGCAWWKTNSNTVTQFTEADAACVLGQVFTAGAFDPAAVVLACAPVTLTQVVAIFDSLVSFYLFPDAGAANTPDGGVGAAAQVCGYGEPTVKGAPACIPHETLLRLLALQAAGHAEQK